MACLLPKMTFMDSVASCEEVKSRINNRMDNLYARDEYDELIPYVCSICDEFLFKKKDICVVSVQKMKKASELLSWSKNFHERERIKALEQYYRFPSVVQLDESERAWLDKMALSPRGSMFRLSRHSSFGFVACERCKEAIDSEYMPLYAIANHNHVGCPPRELLELNDIERAFLTPIRSYGYFFSFEGGHMQQMKGSMTFMRVQERKLTEAVTMLECMGLTKHVIIMTNCKMTEGQQKKAEKLSEFRTDKMIAAVKWLTRFHKTWRNVDVAEVIERIGRTKPIRIEKATTVKSGNAAVEDEVIFTCYYPDGATNTNSGGFSSPEDFKTFVEDLQSKNFDLQFKANLEKEFVTCNDGDHLIGACLLQFPYGVGSLDEVRYTGSGQTTTKSYLPEFLDHLSRKADPLFQTSLLQLIMYSMKNKGRLLRSSCLQLKQKFDSKSLVEQFDIKDFTKAVKARRLKKRQGSKISQKLLDAVDATARELPHTDKAAQRARSSMEAMFHHKGMGSVFLTVTFDDENSILMQVFTGVQIDNNECIDDLTDEQLRERAKKREFLRYDYPGIAALNFEALLSILMEEVLCWDMEANEPIDGKKGLFGKLRAVAFAVEEQGRKTLHIHFILWVNGYKELQDGLFFGDERTKRLCRYEAQNYYDHLASTKLFPVVRSEVIRAFDHDDCTVQKSERDIPEVICDQELRYLRHKKGYEAMSGEFAYCPHCEKKWTYEELVTDYIKQGVGIRDVVTILPTTAVLNEPVPKPRQIQRERLFAKIVEYQKPCNSVEPTACINAAYQCHASCHHKNCFKCGKLRGERKRKHKCGKTCECRYRLPDKKRKLTAVKYEKEESTWYSWSGGKKSQPLLNFLPSRNNYDLFQNVQCEAVSQSKFTCNSNVSVITDGPIGMYACKYINKPNEKDDTVDYSHVEATMKKMAGEGRKHDDDKCEALRIMCRAAFAHNRANVISASMASYLTRHDSRFYFSHKFVYCPLKDVVRLHNKQDVGGTVSVAPSGMCFLENMAFHYLCRPESLEDLNLKSFTEKWQTAYVPRKPKRRNADDREVFPFEIDTGAFRHPSVTTVGRGKNKKKACSQGVKEREEKTYAMVPQWAFPDTETFRSDMLTCSEEDICRPMELHAQYILTLLVPHRSAESLQSSGHIQYPYVHKLREIYDEDEHRRSMGLEKKVFTTENQQFLQNIQNAAYNCTRFKCCFDELANETDPFQGEEDENVFAGATLDSDDEDEEEEEEKQGYEDFLESLEKEFTRPLHDEDTDLLIPTLKNFTFKHIRSNGTERCGFATDLEVPDIFDFGQSFVETTTSRGNASNANQGDKAKKSNVQRTYSCKNLAKVLLQQTSKSHQNVWKGKTIDVQDATGTVASVREWSLAGFEGDKKQERAFEAIIAAFLLTFYDKNGNIDGAENATEDEVAIFQKSYKGLMKLKGNSDTLQLICLLHGPGGSGKSTVIHITVAYAKSFCKLLGHPFNNRTIVLTALSGVAATLLHGETTHMALGLNSRKISNAKKEEFDDTRLVVIDEISFAGVSTVEKIHECIKILSGSAFLKYGGMNVVFAGDFFQLDPVKCSKKLYDSDDVPEWHHSLNCFIELDGKHRFKDDPEWGEILLRFRNGKPTHHDIRRINEECHVSQKLPPKGIQVATYFNKNRDAINSGIFEDWCDAHKPSDGSVLQSACVIMMDDLQMTSSIASYVPVESNAVKKFFYENCSENDCKLPDSAKGRVDPLLKLYPNCPMMLTENKNVPNGQANGSRVHVKRIKLNAGEAPHQLKLDCGTTINAVFVGQVEFIEVEHENDDIIPRVFEVKPQNWTFTTKLQIGAHSMKVNMKGCQFPIISNSCTTGHKLQGCTLVDILVNDWQYKQNWAYVVLSRVRTMAGLYIRETLTHNLLKYVKAPKMFEMLDSFRQRIALPSFSDADYDAMC